MSVVYDIVFRNNRRIPLSGACFGGCAHGSFPSGGIRRNVTQRLSLTDQEMRSLHDTSQDAEFIQFYPTVQTSPGYWRDKAHYYEEMRKLSKELPWLKFTAHPLLGVIRVATRNQPSDKVMMGLFLARNLAQMGYGLGYLRLRNDGLKPKAAAILAHLWYFNGGTPLSPGSVRYNGVGEYNWVSPRTFGIESLRNLVTADADWSPWVQPTWGEQRGYRRDRWFSEHNITHGEVRDRNNRRATQHERTRKLIDCLSAPYDFPIWDNFVQETYEGNRMYCTNFNPSRTDYDGSEADRFLNEVVMPFVAKCREFGYEAMEQVH